MTAVCFGEDHNLDVLGNYLSVDQSLVLTKAAQAAARCFVRRGPTVAGVTIATTSASVRLPYVCCCSRSIRTWRYGPPLAMLGSCRLVSCEADRGCGRDARRSDAATE